MLMCALNGRAESNLVHHRFRFFIHPEVAASLTLPELHSRLAWYVHDLNTIFSRNTIRRFDFNPAVDVIVTDELDSLYGYYPGDLPEGGNYELWAIVKPSTYDFSHGGYMSFATNGAGVSAGMYWHEIYDRNALTNAPVDDLYARDYWRQMNAVAHEMAHVFGAGVGEYYSIATVQDMTGVAPVQNIEFHNSDPSADPYWSQHPDYWNDPLLAWNQDLSLRELLEKVRFAQVSAAMINAGFRNAFPFSRYLPDLSDTTVWLFSEGPQNPVVNAAVRIWKVSARTDAAEEIFAGSSDASGKVQFAWNGSPNNDDNLILIKAFPPLGSPQVRWYSVYEAQEQKILFGRDRLNIYLDLAPDDAPPVLALSEISGGMVLSWTNVIDYVLEQTQDLDSAHWQFVNRVLQTNGTVYSVLLPTNTGPAFFRLRKP